MENQEHVLVPASTEATGVVMVIWSDPDETPLEAIGRLNSEVAETQNSAELIEAIKTATSEVQDAIYNLESVTSACGDVENALSTAQDALENVELP